jgi:hypothetical protein
MLLVLALFCLVPSCVLDVLETATETDRDGHRD